MRLVRDGFSTVQRLQGQINKELETILAKGPEQGKQEPRRARVDPALVYEVIAELARRSHASRGQPSSSGSAPQKSQGGTETPRRGEYLVLLLPVGPLELLTE